ncbi:hypothetical protein ABZ379_21085 [Streptomyces canus]|uniref:hypothetical protein n=1 Tax=Streptomyces canus TaxID=58343 RepID=UPI0033DDDC2B
MRIRPASQAASPSAAFRSGVGRPSWAAHSPTKTFVELRSLLSYLCVAAWAADGARQ